MELLRVKNLKKSYGELVAVDGISFTVEQGEVFALLGPNGAGKTSTIKCILGLRKKDSGEIVLNSSVAYLPEKKELYRSYTVERMIKTAKSYGKNFDEKKAYSLVEEFKLNPSEKVANLSHGMATLLYLAITLAEDVTLYVMDEPTWGLDPLMRNKVLSIMRKLSLDGKAVLYTSHILSEVEKVADRVAIMRKGKIVEMGPLDDIKEKYILVSVPKGESVEGGYFYKETTEEEIYLVEKATNIEGQPASFDAIFEALVKGERK